MPDRNVALDSAGNVWAQGEYTDLWRCLTPPGTDLRLRYNDLVASFGPVETLHPAIEKYQPVR